MTRTISQKKEEVSQNWFLFAMLFFIVEYGRPQDVLPIGFLRPALILTVILTFYVISNLKLLKGKGSQLAYIWAFIILLAFHVPFAQNNFWAFRTMRGMLLMMPFILSLVVVLNNMDRLRTYLIIFTCLIIYIAQYSLTHSGVGSGYFLADENDLSLLINMWLPFNYFLFLQEKEKWKKMLHLVGGLLGLMAVVVSFSRGGFLGLLAAGFVIWYGSNRKMLTLTVIMLVAVGFLLYSGEEYLQEMSTVTDTEEGTGKARIDSWASGWDMFIDNPLGVGGNNFQWRFSEYQGDRFSRGMGGRVAHSLWFTLLPETGILGVFIYFRLLFLNIGDIRRMRGASDEQNEDLQYINAISMALLASFAGYFASATFISVLYYPHFWYMCAFIVAARSIQKKILFNRESLDSKAKNNNMVK